MPFLFHFLSKWQDRDHLLIQTLSVFLPGVTHFDVPRNVCHVPPNPTLCHLYYTFQAFLVVYRHPLTHGGLRAYGSENRDPAALPTDPPASYIISFLWRLTPDGENKRQALFRDLLAPTDWNPVLDACARRSRSSCHSFTWGLPGHWAHLTFTLPTSNSYTCYRENEIGVKEGTIQVAWSEVCPEGDILGENWMVQRSGQRTPRTKLDAFEEQQRLED